jgi:hypothetical protein
LAAFPTSGTSKEVRFLTYKQKDLADDEAHDLVIQDLHARVIPATKIPHVLNDWRDPRHPEFRQGNTAWRWFNAVTEVLKGSLDRLPRRTQALHGLLDAHCGSLTADRNSGSPLRRTRSSSRPCEARAAS